MPGRDTPDDIHRRTKEANCGKRASHLRARRMGRRAQGAAHRGGARPRRSNPRARSRAEELVARTREREAGEVRVRKNVRTDRESIEVERVPLSGGRLRRQIGEDEVVVPVEHYKIGEVRRYPKRNGG